MNFKMHIDFKTYIRRTLPVQIGGMLGNICCCVFCSSGWKAIDAFITVSCIIQMACVICYIGVFESDKSEGFFGNQYVKEFFGWTPNDNIRKEPA